jgi:LIVCS family branched-chain amino acid:cation transporter
MAFSTGFSSGYMTMDALAGLAFGIIVVRAIQNLGVTRPQDIALGTIKAGAISAVFMAILYAVLAYMGLTAISEFDRASNGGIIIAEIARYYFGTLGSLLTAIIVILACLKTGVGLITAFGDTFKELFPKTNYQWLILGAAGVPLLLANIGLTQIIAISEPFLDLLYPIAIVLILLGLLSRTFGDARPVYVTTIAFVTIPAVLSGLDALPASLHHGALQSIINLGQFLPGFDQSLGWTVPALVGFIISFAVVKVKARRG